MKVRSKNRKVNEQNKTDSLFLRQIPTDYRYSYEILQKKHIDRVVKMFTHAFCDSEPMTHYVGMEYQGFTPFAKAVTEKAAKDGLSIVALDGDRIIACTLVEDIKNPLDLNFEIDPRFKYIFALLEHLTAHFFVHKELNKNHVAHLFITAVDEDYRGQGLSKQVNFRAMALAAQKGFSFMYSELTNIYNEKGIIHHLTLGKLLIGSCIYKDFSFDGIKPFEKLVGSATGYLWELKKGAKLTYHQDDEKYEMSLSKNIPKTFQF